MNINDLKKSYLIGFILSLIFTILPFYITIYNIFNTNILLIMIIVCAVIQIYIHLIYFLKIDNIFNKQWNILSLIFTIFILFILVFGSIWIMKHLHHNLMIP